MSSRVSHGQQTPQHGWLKAAYTFVRDEQRSKLLRTLFAYGPFAVLNDFFLPVVGTVDDPYIPVWLLILLFVIPKIKQYRTGNQHR